MKRKLMAFSLAMAMTVSSASMAFGADPVVKDSEGKTITPVYTTGADGKQTWTASATVEGDATINYVDKDITIVDLPTAKPDFVLDPQGLYGAINDADYGSDDSHGINDLASTYEGKVVGKDVLQITNRGANKIKVDATFVATSTATDDATKPSFVATAGDVDDDTEDNTINLEVALATALVKGDVASTPTTANGDPVFVKKASTSAPGDKTETVFTASATAKTAFTNTGKTVSFVLDGDGTYGYKDDTSGGGHDFSYVAGQVIGGTSTKGNTSPVAQALYISGTMNKNADWSKYAGGDPANKVGVKVIYSVAKATATDTGAVTDAVSGFIKADAIAGGTVVATGDATSAVIDFTPSAISTATLADYIKINNVVLSNDSNWSRGVLGSLSGNRITLTTRGLTAAGITGTGNYDVEVKDSEGNTYTCQLTIA